jgi:ribosomal protein RSM22 (predicted rRNA methylase)
VVSAYALAELSPAARTLLVAAAWHATSHVLVLVEPGTPVGFEHVLAARAALARDGAQFIAPCPHEGPCPLRTGARTDDWCHFSVRVPRTRRHRQLKGGSLGYEDEKFAYLVATRRPVAAARPARVLRHPRIEKGRIGLTLCTPDGADRVVVSRRDAAWPAARKASWGDAWPTTPRDD